MKHKTTKEHYDKYENARKKMGVTFKDSNMFGTADSLREHYLSNGNVNVAPLCRFDAFHGFYRPLADPGWSMSQTTCLIKHCLLYEVLGLEPEFVEEHVWAEDQPCMNSN